MNWRRMVTVLILGGLTWLPSPSSAMAASGALNDGENYPPPVSVNSELAVAGSAFAYGPDGARATVFVGAYRDEASRVWIELLLCDAPGSCDRWRAERDSTALEMAWDGVGGDNPFLRTTIDGVGVIDVEFVGLGWVLGHMECADARIPTASSVTATGPQSRTVDALIEGTIGDWTIPPDGYGCALWSSDAVFAYAVG